MIEGFSLQLVHPHVTDSLEHHLPDGVGLTPKAKEQLLDLQARCDADTLRALRECKQILRDLHGAYRAKYQELITADALTERIGEQELALALEESAEQFGSASALNSVTDGIKLLEA